MFFSQTNHPPSSGFICELRRPRLPELYALLQDFFKWQAKTRSVPCLVGLYVYMHNQLIRYRQILFICNIFCSTLAYPRIKVHNHKNILYNKLDEFGQALCPVVMCNQLALVAMNIVSWFFSIRDLNCCLNIYLAAWSKPHDGLILLQPSNFRVSNRDYNAGFANQVRRKLVHPQISTRATRVLTKIWRFSTVGGPQFFFGAQKIPGQIMHHFRSLHDKPQNNIPALPGKKK